MQHMKMEATSKQISTWKQVCDRLPTNIFVFIRQEDIIFKLLNNSNLHRWGEIDSAACDLCSLRQTQCHMLASCPVAAEEGRYTWRHDSVLNTKLMYLSQLTSYGYTLYDDLPGYFHPNAFFRSMRSDIVLTKNDDIYIIELTCCFETNTKKSRRYKMKNKDIEIDCHGHFKNFQKIFIEIITLGLITHNIKEIY